MLAAALGRAGRAAERRARALARLAAAPDRRRCPGHAREPVAREQHDVQQRRREADHGLDAAATGELSRVRWATRRDSRAARPGRGLTPASGWPGVGARPARYTEGSRLCRRTLAASIPPMAVAVSTAAEAPAEDALSLGGVSARKALLLVGTAVLLVVSVVLLAPAFADLPATWERLAHGDLGWLALALALRRCSPSPATSILFSASPADGGHGIGLRASPQINLAGHAATRLFASAGAGGIALTAWAMRRSGMERADVAARMVAFHVLLYGVYMGALLVGGLGLYTGVLPGGGSFAITVVPAIFGGAVIALVAAAQLVRPGEGRVRRSSAPVGARRARRPPAAAHRQPRPDRRPDVVGLPDRRAVGVLRGLRRAPAVRRPRRRLLRRHARQPAPAPRRRRRRRRRHGRRADRLRRRARARR